MNKHATLVNKMRYFHLTSAAKEIGLNLSCTLSQPDNHIINSIQLSSNGYFVRICTQCQLINEFILLPTFFCSDCSHKLDVDVDIDFRLQNTEHSYYFSFSVAQHSTFVSHHKFVFFIYRSNW